MFADAYAPTAHGVPLPGVTVGEATGRDLPGAAALLAAREGEAVELWVDRLWSWRAAGQRVFVARAGAVVGCARLAWLTPDASGGRAAPDGWYLHGLVVDRRYRRRGIGRALTRARCAWVWERDERVFCAVNAHDRASMDLHRELGLRELTRDFDLPGVTFTGGEGVLFGAGADSHRQQVVQLRVAAAG